MDAVSGDHKDLLQLILDFEAKVAMQNEQKAVCCSGRVDGANQYTSDEPMKYTSDSRESNTHKIEPDSTHDFEQAFFLDINPKEIPTSDKISAPSSYAQLESKSSQDYHDEADPNWIPTGMRDSNLIRTGHSDRSFSDEAYQTLIELFDGCLAQLRKNLLLHGATIRDKLEDMTKDQVYCHMRGVLMQSQQLTEQVASLRELVKHQERQIAQKDQVIDDLRRDLERANDTSETTKRDYMILRKKFLTGLAEKSYQSRLCHRVLTKWQLVLERTWRARYLAKLRAEAREECDRLTKEFGSKTQRLESELKVARLELDAMRASQAEETASLRMALMRGVCALNMETMNLFNREGQKADGDQCQTELACGTMDLCNLKTIFSNILGVTGIKEVDVANTTEGNASCARKHTKDDCLQNQEFAFVESTTATRNSYNTNGRDEDCVETGFSHTAASRCTISNKRLQATGKKELESTPTLENQSGIRNLEIYGDSVDSPNLLHHPFKRGLACHSSPRQSERSPANGMNSSRPSSSRPKSFARTVQYGIPTGPSLMTSLALSNVRVVRHHQNIPAYGSGAFERSTR